MRGQHDRVPAHEYHVQMHFIKEKTPKKHQQYTRKMGIWLRTSVFLSLYNQILHSKSYKKTHPSFKRYLFTKDLFPYKILNTDSNFSKELLCFK